MPVTSRLKIKKSIRTRGKREIKGVRFSSIKLISKSHIKKSKD
jgi:hypothetical protein